MKGCLIDTCGPRKIFEADTEKLFGKLNVLINGIVHAPTKLTTCICK